MNTRRRLRSESWWNDPGNPGMTALYIERMLNQRRMPHHARHSH